MNEILTYLTKYNEQWENAKRLFFELCFYKTKIRIYLMAYVLSLLLLFIYLSK